MSVYQPQQLRGAHLLLMHCRAVGNDGPSAFTRLQRELGDELARLLVFALSRPASRRDAA